MEYNSAVECHPDTMKVGGSSPPIPTKINVMKNIVKIINMKKRNGFQHIGYDEYIITYLKSNKVHLLRVVVNGRLTNSAINLIDGKSGYKKIILKAISDYKNNRLKTDPNSVVKKTIKLGYINDVFSKKIFNNITSYLLSINKEERRETLTEFELI